MNKLFSFMWCIAIVLSCLPMNASADLGPKPKVDIDIVYNRQKIQDAHFYAKMLECDEKERMQETMEYGQDSVAQLRISSYDAAAGCYWQPAPLAWGGQCSDSHCNFGYFPPREFKLAIYIPSLEKTFTTNKITRENFSSRYQVDLFADGIAKITETTPLWASIHIPEFAKALIITTILELLVTWIFVAVRKLPRKRILVSVLFANLLSLPVVWFLFPLIDASEMVVMVIFELFAVIFEAYFIHHFCKQIIFFRQTLLLSSLNNLISVVLGIVALIALAFAGFN